MKINGYSFGKITVDDETYSSDVILFPDKIQEGWKREHGHSLVLEDIGEVIKYSPDVIIVGTGKSGILKVPPETVEAIEKLNIKFIAKPTGEASNIFNEYVGSGERVVGAFHLTC